MLDKWKIEGGLMRGMREKERELYQYCLPSREIETTLEKPLHPKLTHNRNRIDMFAASYDAALP